MEKEDRLVFRPQLLLLAPFLATLDAFVANLRVVRDVTDAPDSFGMVAVSMLGACALAGLIFMLAPRTREALCRLTRRRILAAAALYSLAQAAFWYLAIWASGAPAAAIGVLGVVMGCCLVPLFMAWQACYGTDFRSILFHGGLSAIASTLITLVILLLDPLVAGTCWCLCTLVGAFAPVFLHYGDSAGRDVWAIEGTGACPAHGDGPCASAPAPIGYESQAKSLTSVFSGLWLPLLGLLICMLCSTVAEVQVDGRVMRGEFPALIVSSIAAVALCCVHTKAPLTLVVDKLAAPALVACAIIVGSSSEAFLGSTFGASLSLVPVMFMSLYALASLAAVQGRNRALAASAVLCACCLSMLLGSALNGQLTEMEANGPLVRMLTYAYYALVLVDLGYVAWKLLVEKADAATGQAAVADTQAFEAAQDERVARLAATHGLTGREREVLEQLALGHNSRYIAGTLLISESTVRTHMRSIYRKLGVSTQSELVLLASKGGPAAG